MKAIPIAGPYSERAGNRGIWLGLFLAQCCVLVSDATAETAPPTTPMAKVVEKVLEVEAKRPPEPWVPAEVGRELITKEKVAAHAESRAVVRLSNKHLLRVAANSELVILPPRQGAPIGMELRKGEVYLHSRGESGELSIKTPAGLATAKGTQFRIHVAEDGTTTCTMFEGMVELRNDQGYVDLAVLGNGKVEEGLMAPGRKPYKTARLDAKTTIQWCLYYPGVVHLPDLHIPPGEAATLAPSLSAYQSGDLLGALSAWPEGYRAVSADAKDFRAMILLSVGEVDKAQGELKGAADSEGKRAIKELIDAVNLVDRGPRSPPVSASGWLARSYQEQSRGRLEQALLAAKRARDLAPDFGFAAVRVAELEFSFGRVDESKRHLEEGLKLSPRNAQGHSLLGFLLCAQNCIDAGRESFETAIDLDSGLGNAWLGRGLCSIRQGRVEEGYQDLQTAVTLEPNRSLLHSYLAKAASQSGMKEAGKRDFDYAKTIDPFDPTPWLYSAIELQRMNRTNAAIDDLQRSILLNNNRLIYRSNLLLDQDRAVRSANLAKIYQSAGMQEVAVREATRAVESDYTNASAHLFLANSFDALRDPERIQLRYETPWFNELLLANLLSPVGGGPLSQFVSQQEYSKLLESDGLGGSLTTEWRSDSEVRSAASIFGTYGQVSFGLDAYYRDDSGDRPNSEFELAELYGQLKWQAGPDDTFYFLGKWQEQHAGDNFDYYDNRTLSPYQDFEENQEPGLLLAGWNHRWAPGAHTLFLAGRLSASQRLLDRNPGVPLVVRTDEGLTPGFLDGMGGFSSPRLAALYPGGQIDADDEGNPVYTPALLHAIKPFLGTGQIDDIDSAPMDLATRREFDILSADLQQIHTLGAHTLLGGLRVQSGEFETRSRVALRRSDVNAGDFVFPTPASDQWAAVDFERLDLYAYDYWRVNRSLLLVGGVSWQSMDYPDNFRLPPINDVQREDEALSGKFGFTYSPGSFFNLRGAYAEGLGGVSFDESVRLEPVQISGFNQAYRSAIPESIAGSVEAPRYKIWGLSADGRLPTDTWWGVALNSIDQNVRRSAGIFTGYDIPIFDDGPLYFADTTPVRLAYREESLAFTLDQLIGEEFAIGAGYRVTRSDLRTTYTELVEAGDLAPRSDVHDVASLHEFSLHGDWYSPTGLFARVEANLFSQDLEDDPRGRRPRRGDEFWQFNALVGYRFNDNLCEVSAGVLNIAGTDYHLSPLNPRDEIAHDRTAFMRCRLSF